MDSDSLLVTPREFVPKRVAVVHKLTSYVIKKTLRAWGHFIRFHETNLLSRIWTVTELKNGYLV